MDEFNKVQAELSKALSTRQQLEAQLQENEQVLIELKLIKDDGVVYKLVGPTMLKQDLKESRENVSKRIDYIRLEVYSISPFMNWLLIVDSKKLDGLCKDLVTKQETFAKTMNQAA